MNLQASSLFPQRRHSVNLSMKPVRNQSQRKLSLPSLSCMNGRSTKRLVLSIYLIFGTILFNDEDGSLLKTIQDDCHYKCDRINCNILCDWVRGKGRPVTWRVLIETLRTCNLNELANKIQEETQALVIPNSVWFDTDHFLISCDTQCVIYES